MGGRQPEPRTSGLETTVFNVLDYVLGCGEQDVPVPFDGRMNLDMLFEAVSGFRLGIEYDGAYWHADREDRDSRKSERLVYSGFVHEVLRIREEPLQLVGPLDVSVRRGAAGQEVAGIVLAHISHTVASAFGRETEERIGFSVRRPARTVDLARVACRDCRRLMVPTFFG